MRCSSLPNRVVIVTKASKSTREPQRAPESTREPQRASESPQRAPEGENVEIPLFFKTKAMHRHTQLKNMSLVLNNFNGFAKPPLKR